MLPENTFNVSKLRIHVAYVNTSVNISQGFLDQRKLRDWKTMCLKYVNTYQHPLLVIIKKLGI